MTDIFAIAPASHRPAVFLAAICAFLVAIIALLAWVAYSSRHSRVEVGTEAIRLVGDLWGRSVPLRSLDLTRARVVDLDASPDYRPRRRTMGTGLGGYASGWFRLASGEKALLYVTDRRRVAYIPTTEGYALLLSVEPGRVPGAAGPAPAFVSRTPDTLRGGR